MSALVSPKTSPKKFWRAEPAPHLIAKWTPQNSSQGAGGSPGSVFWNVSTLCTLHSAGQMPLSKCLITWLETLQWLHNDQWIKSGLTGTQPHPTFLTSYPTHPSYHLHSTEIHSFMYLKTGTALGEVFASRNCLLLIFPKDQVRSLAHESSCSNYRLIRQWMNPSWKTHWGWGWGGESRWHEIHVVMMELQYEQVTDKWEGAGKIAKACNPKKENLYYFHAIFCRWTKLNMLANFWVTVI